MTLTATLFVIVVVTCNVVRADQQLYSAAKSNGVSLCAVDSPLTTVEVSSSRQCAARCLERSDQCTDFNVVDGEQTVNCQLYFGKPTFYSLVPNCASFGEVDDTALLGICAQLANPICVGYKNVRNQLTLRNDGPLTHRFI